MSSNDNEKTKRHVYCVICFSKFTSRQPELIPRKLNCRHDFCTGCLLKLQEYQGDVIECPTCKVRTVLPVTSILGLDKNYGLLIEAMETEKDDKILCNFCIRKLVYPPRTVTLNCFDCAVLFCGQCSDEIHQQLEFQTHNVCLVTSDENDTTSSRSSSTFPSSDSYRKGSGRPTMSRRISSPLDSIPDCDEHQEKLKLFCEDCGVVCCTYCQIEGEHMNHKCFHIDEAEDLDKRRLCRLQQKVEEYGEKYIKSRSEVQRTIEEVKKKDVVVKDDIRRYYRELRNAIDNSEKIVLEEIGRRNKTSLRQLNEQLSAMIKISSKARSASRRCDSIVKLNYFDMIEVKKDVENDIKDVLNMECQLTPCATASLQCQFPNHELLLNQLVTCAKLISAPEPPLALTCDINKNPLFLTLEWKPPASSPYIYPVQNYLVQNDTGEDNTFIEIYKGPSTKVTIGTESGAVVVNGDSTMCLPERESVEHRGQRVQFRVAAINIVGQSLWSSPTAIRLPHVTT